MDRPPRDVTAMCATPSPSIPGTQLVALPPTPLLIQFTSVKGEPRMLTRVPAPVMLALRGSRTFGSVMTATSKPLVVSDPAKSTSRENVLPTVRLVPPRRTGDVEHPVGAVA